MGMNERELERVVEALQRCVGIRLQNAWQPSRDRVVLGLSDGSFLLIVPRGPHARLHTVRGRPRNPPKPFSFQGACRAHLMGPITAVDKVKGERIVDLCFGARRLHLRLTGGSGGLWLLDAETVSAAYDGPAPNALPNLIPRRLRDDEPRFAPRDGETWDRAADRWFGELERRKRLAETRTATRRALKRHLARKQRLLAHLHGDLERASEAPTLRGMADLLAANLHNIRRGIAKIDLRSLEDPDRIVSLELDPARPPVATMERLYAKARRLDRVADRVLERLDEVEAALERLREAMAEVETADSEALRNLRTLAPRQNRGAKREVRRPWVTWLGPHEETVLVGRDAKGNRRLTFQRGRGHHYWLHIRGKPGAHLLIPLEKDHSPPLELLLAAAQIALVHAKITEGARADVQYTRIRNVRSIPGAADGRVLVNDEKVLHVIRDPSVLVGWTRD